LAFIDFFIKAYNRFPSSQWWGEWREGKLYPVEGKVRGACQLVMKQFNGISEQNLVLFFIAFEAIFAIIVLLLHVHFLTFAFFKLLNSFCKLYHS
jgi:hypothetical protein